MNLRSVAEAIFNAIVTWGYWAIGLVAVVAFLAPLLEPATEEDPTGGAGVSAPIIALCVAAVLLSQALSSGGMRLRRVPSIFIGIGSVASAYLWIAAEARVHPSDPQLPLILGILLLVAAFATIVVPFLAFSVRQRPSNQDNDEQDRPDQEETPNE